MSSPGPGPGETAWVANQRKWASGWRRTVFPGIFLVYLLQVGGAIANDSRGAAAVAGYVILAAFCVCYLLVLSLTWQQTSVRFRALHGAWWWRGWPSCPSPTPTPS